MRKSWSRAAALGLAAVTAASTVLTGCGGKKADGDKNSFTYMLDATDDYLSTKSYNDNLAVKYWLDKEWKPAGEDEATKINVKFSVPPTGSEQDNFNTLISTGDYLDVMGMSYSSETVSKLYDDGIAIDLTDYIKKYMPNYSKWLKDHPDEAEEMKVDGKYLQLFNVSDTPRDAWGMIEYRRDWIVKYGTNPQTGAKFTGGYQADGTWTDDVVFPSGGTDPMYISDWEWMFDIFNTALKDQGITDGYAVQTYYTGYYTLGEVNTSFGGGSALYYKDKDGKIRFGGYSDHMRAYIEAMNHWYQEGWLDPKFDERAKDVVWFTIDNPTVYSGKCGMWYGELAQLEDGMENKDDPILNGIHVAAAPEPINDVYGTDADKNVKPDTFYQEGVVTTSVIITNKAEEKNLPALLTAIDYLYGDEGAKLHAWGFDKSQQKELEGIEGWDKSLVYGYEETKDAEGNTVYLNNAELAQVKQGTLNAPQVGRVVGRTMDGMQNTTNSDLKRHYIDLADMYKATGNVSSLVTSKLTADESAEGSQIQNNAMTYMNQTVPQFIKGELNINDDAAWKDYADTLKGYDVDKYAEYQTKAMSR